MNGRPNPFSDVQRRGNSRSPNGCEPRGDGDPIVVRGRENRPHGEGGQVVRWRQARGTRDEKRRSDTETYRQRFAIETTYRQLHQARIRTTTRDPVRRLFYVGIALILRNVWVGLHRTVLARRRRGSREIRLDSLRFRRMLLWLAHVVEQRLGVRDPVTVQLC